MKTKKAKNKGKSKGKDEKKKRHAKKKERPLPKIDIDPDLARGKCPKGMFYDEKTGACELNIFKPPRRQAKTRKRGNVSINIPSEFNVDFATAKRRTVVRNNTPIVDRLLGKFYKDRAKRENRTKALTKKKALKNLDKIHSYSPEVNRQLVTMRTIARNTIDDCKTFDSVGTPKVRVGGTGRCLPFTDPEAQDFLLTNLASKSKPNCNKIIAPRQVASNCWFNTMFMTFFISDKGRKFFRFFRQLMIQGTNSRGVPIAKNLHNAFFRLNMAIEACLGSNSGSNSAVARKLALNIDTNVIIQKIYNAIPTKFRRGIPRRNMHGNPLTYYETIINYLGNDPLRLLDVSIDGRDGAGNDWKKILQSRMVGTLGDNLPDVVVMEFHDEAGSEYRAFDSARKSNKETSFVLQSGGESAQYVLDSAIVRDVEQNHFCSTLMCNGKQFGFDGVSFGRLNPFSWRKLINTDRAWTFEGSDTDWNFRNSYQLLFYYRT